MVCKSCNLSIINDANYCPLCNISMVKDKDSKTELELFTKFAYPMYEKRKKKTVQKILAFVSIAISILCMFINVFTLDAYYNAWSFIVASSLLCAYRSIYDWVSSIKNSGSKIVSQFIWLSQLMLVIDISIGYSGWALSYVVPWFSITTTLAITIVALANKKNYTEYTGYLMASIAISIRLAFVAILPVTIIKWALFAALLYSVLTILGLYMFSKPQFKSELKMRFKR